MAMMKVCPKYEVGNIVNLHTKVARFELVTCPICKGNFSAPNPNFDDEDEECVEDATLYCSVCQDGFIRKRVGFEIFRSPSEYKVTAINAIITADEISYRYELTSTDGMMIRHEPEHKIIRKEI